MPKKRGRGRRRKKGGFRGKRELVFKEEGQEYAQCLKLLGNGRMNVFCFDGKTRLAKIRGKFFRRVWVNIGDIVLVQKRNFSTEDNKCEVVYVYYPDEVRKLKQMGELPSDLEVKEKQEDSTKGDLNIEFEDEEVKKTKKSKKQNLEDFMPPDSSEEEEEELVEDKTSQTKKKQLVKKKEEKIQESSDSEEEVDDLADI